MAECLVTKLKSVVNDENLLKLGELRVRVGGALAITSSNSTTLKCITGTFEDGTTEKTVKGYTDFSGMTNPSVVSIIPKYNLATITGWNGLYVNLKDLSACNKLTRLQVWAESGSFEDVNNYSNASRITSLDISPERGFKQSKLEELTNLKAVTSLTIRSSDLSLVTLNLNNLPILFPNLIKLELHAISITGSINELILPSTCTSCKLTGIPATLTGSKATFLANNPQVTTTDFDWSSGITA